MKIRSIAIRFGDNDFQGTFLPLLDSVLKAAQEESFSHYEIVRLINEGSLYHYHAFQNRFRYMDTPEHDKHIEGYLKVKESQVFLNDEADKMSVEWNNSETFYVSIYLPCATSI